MSAVTSKQRIIRKFSKYKQKHSVFSAVARITFYIFRELATYFLVTIALKIKQDGRLLDNKKILFLEPKNQGYGDLIFQTPIFKALDEAGYEVSLIMKKNHEPILFRNKHISHIFYWENLSYSKILQRDKYGYVIFLGRDTFSETLLGLGIFSAKKIILDQDLILWKSLFSQNHTLAWQELIKKHLDPNLKFSEPEIYPPRITNNEKIKKVAIVVGIIDPQKSYPQMVKLLEILKSRPNTSFYLLGKGDKKQEEIFDKINQKNFTNLVNQRTYLETMELISTMDAVIGTEGSLVHVSTTVGIPTIIIEIHDQFWKYSNLSKTESIKPVKGNTSPEKIVEILGGLLD